MTGTYFIVLEEVATRSSEDSLLIYIVVIAISFER